jgi:hypothetical protein
MDLNAAFLHFLDNSPKEVDYFLVGSWRYRNNKGLITDKKKNELLEQYGYTNQTFERWTLPGQLPEFTIMYVDANGFGCTRVNAKNKLDAYDQVRKANPERKKLTDVTYCSIDQAINKMNLTIQFENEGS